MEFECDVLIVGAGPVGLALATELTHHGQSALVIERNDRVGVQPRAKTTNVRTMTQMRRWGLAAEVRRRSPLPEGFPRRTVFQTGLFGHEIFAFDNSFNSEPDRNPFYPENAEFIPQYVIEGILCEHVQGHVLSNVSFGETLDSFTQDSDGVTAHVTGASGPRTIRARYLVGADGGRSTVRKTLGIAMQGKSNLVSFVTLILRIPGLSADPELRAGLFHWIVDPEAPSFMGPMDRNDVWNWAMTVRPDMDTDTETLLGFARKAMGKDYPIEVMARDEWTVHSLLADEYRKDRVFLAGDACHLHAPFGGHGMNLGIGDGVDLGWKLSAVLKGWGTDQMLDSYQTERRQTHLAVMESATSNLGSLSQHFANPDLMSEGPEGETARAAAARAIETLKAPEFRSLGLVLGYRYQGSPLVSQEATAAPAVLVSDYRPTGYAGSLAPHDWIGDRSVYDLFDKGYTLLRLGQADLVAETALVAGAKKAGIPLGVVAPGHAALAALYGASYALVRPDQHVAWRGHALPQADDLLALMQGRHAGEA